MLIRFDELEPSVVSHMKGGEGEARLQLVQDVDNKIMRSVLAPGASIGLHTHETSSEVMYFLSGTGKVLYDGVWEPVAPGTCHYCPKGHSHSLVNDGTEDLVNLNLAYAATIHKAMGSEYDIVLMPVVKAHYMMLYRNLLYTGITRARKKVVLAGEKSVLFMEIAN